ncbi:hypothetical protein E4U42_000515 [Claviceps africana]|uniref:16 kDa allergen n=1 Tax=Claviceps africana TaxID=83212 RepID=A0A8K0J0M0_9HYPO|nr:hypothetical protein E4U42_000515 [Claviceps africana]
MKASIVAAAAAMVGAASAQYANVISTCHANIYAQSFPAGGGAPGEQKLLSTGQTFFEPLRDTGSTIKIAKDAALSGPLFFGYSFNDAKSIVYYEFSSEWGNPFLGAHNILEAEGCKSFDCKKDDAGCYSTKDHKQTFECPMSVNVTAHICVQH